MPVFEYTGLTEAGKNVRGIRDAESSKVLRQVLRKDGVYLTEARPRRRPARGRRAEDRLAREVDVAPCWDSPACRAGPGHRTRQLATLISAGIPLVRP